MLSKHDFDGRPTDLTSRVAAMAVDADVVMVIDGGRIVERGSHETLISNQGRYHELYTAQFRDTAESRLMGMPPVE